MEKRYFQKSAREEKVRVMGILLEKIKEKSNEWRLKQNKRHITIGVLKAKLEQREQKKYWRL